MRRLLCVAPLILLTGCAATPHQPASNAPAPVDQAQAVQKSGFSAQCPPNWKLVNKGGDYALAAMPKSAERKSASDGSDNPMISIQVPSLPPHIPGFIPLDGVANGYVQDLKKRYPDQKVDEQQTVQIDGNKARRIVSSFQNNGKPFRELALLAVHGDHVYVITGTCSAPAFGDTKSAFDALAASLKWTAK